MSLDTFKKVIDMFESNGVGARLTINGNGEPLINPHLLDMLRLPISDSLVMQMISNGTLLNDHIIAGLIDSNLNFLQFSIDSVYRDEYQKNRPGKNPGKDYYGILMRNVLKLVVENERAGHPLFISISVMGTETINSTRQVAFWKPLVDNVYVEELNNFGANRTVEEIVEVRDQALRPQCGHLYDYVYVRADGSVKACCEDVHGHYLIGNVATDSFEQIWNGQRMQAIRAANLEPDTLRSCDLNGLDCHSCDSPWRGIALQNRIDFIGRSLTLECKAKSFRARLTQPSANRMALAGEYLEQLERHGDIVQLID